MREEDAVLQRYLGSAQKPWPEDYAAMQPRICIHAEGDYAGGTDLLQRRLQSGILREVSYARRDLSGGILVLANCDVQGAGFVCGLGFAPTEAEADQLAARQAIERLLFPEDNVRDLKHVAESVRGHEHHAEAAEPAKQAAEALEVLGENLKEVQVTAFCPCGTAWMSAISATVFDSRVLASSADWDKETALALAAEIFISRLRWAIKVPAGDPHDPHEWARTWFQRAPSGRPWGGVADRNLGELVWLPELGGPGGTAELEAVLGPKEDREAHSRELQAALKRRAAKEDEDDGGAGGRRKRTPFSRYEVTPGDRDPRRPELVGKLPVEQIRADLGKALTDSQVVMVSGGTGSGKSTQLPQFLIDDWRGQEDGARSSGAGAPRVVVTQPRRIAAISVAERVAWERRERVGSSVGYSVHGNTVRPMSPAGSIDFVTVGTLLRRAVSDPLLSGCDVVVVDEVHERDMLTDFLLILLRELLVQRRDLRLVLMSATLDVDTFTKYFDDCPMLEVPSATRYPVEEVHLEDSYFEQFDETDSLLRNEESGRFRLRAEVREQARRQGPPKAVWWGNRSQDTTFVKLLDSAVRKLVPEVAERPSQSILCFLPGWSEIRMLTDSLRDGPESNRIWALPLHSMLPKDQQQQVFTRAPKGKVKVILGTNVAESSVTIDDITVVIDSGLQRELRYDPGQRMATLETCWVSRSNAIQRKGRAGRVQAGRVLRLYTKEQMQIVPERPAPEMQRCDLAQACLQAVALGRDPHLFLAEAPDPPSPAAIQNAMDLLNAIDAVEGADSPSLLPVGEVLARLPLEPLLGRALMVGCLLGVPHLAAAVLVVSGGGRSAFLQQGSKQETLQRIREFCDWSDTLAATKALLKFEDVRFKKGEEAARRWAHSSAASWNSLGTLSRAKSQLLRDMRRAGLLSQDLSVGNHAASRKKQTEGSRELLNAREEMSLDADDDEQDEGAPELAPAQRGLSVFGIDEESEALLVAVLCCAYPTNLALQPHKDADFLRINGVKNAKISSGSVNHPGKIRRGHDDGRVDGARWWLFGDMQVNNNRGYLNNTTRLEEWQLGMFAGLKWVGFNISKEPAIELDGWVTVRAKPQQPGSARLMQDLRDELRDALEWQALAALGQDDAATAAARHACLRLQASVGVLAGRRPHQSVLEALKKGWTLDGVGSSGGARGSRGVAPKGARATKQTQPAQAQQRRNGHTRARANAADEEMEASGTITEGSLRQKKVVQLKGMCRERGLKVTGKKAELVDRLLNA